MFVSVVIPVYNREKLIVNCINSILQQTYSTFEVLVVDDGSSDNTLVLLESISDSRLRILKNNQRKGPSVSRNMAIQEGRGDIFAFIDSDCLAKQDWLTELVKGYTINEKIMMVGGKVVEKDSENYWEAVNEGLNFVSNNDGYVPHIIGCNMSAKAQFIKNHLFDERIKYPPAAGEDSDVCIRCRQQGHMIYYNQKAEVLHFHRSDLFSTIRQHYYYGFGNSYISFKHKHFPFINYGTWLMLIFLICIFLSFFNKGFWLIIVGVIFLFNAVIIARFKPSYNYSVGGWLKRYPGLCIKYTSECVGNLSYCIKAFFDNNWRSF